MSAIATNAVAPIKKNVSTPNVSLFSTSLIAMKVVIEPIAINTINKIDGNII